MLHPEDDKELSPRGQWLLAIGNLGLIVGHMNPRTYAAMKRATA